jgi:hypothetical protein
LSATDVRVLSCDADDRPPQPNKQGREPRNKSSRQAFPTDRRHFTTELLREAVSAVHAAGLRGKLKIDNC